MALSEGDRKKLKRFGLKGLNKPKRSPKGKKSHVVAVRDKGKVKIIRFGERGASTAGKPKAGESAKMKAKRKSFKARHRKNIAKGKSSPAFWADKFLWAGPGGSTKLPPKSQKHVKGLKRRK